MLHMEAREPGACARAAPIILAHLSFIFVLHGGALFATSARLKWDPITYIPLRELMPAEYRALCFALPLAGLALLALAHLAIAALAASSHSTRRTLYLIIAVMGGILVISELVFGAVGALHIRAWLRTEVAEQLQQTLEVREHLVPLLAALERWHPLPEHIKNLMNRKHLNTSSKMRDCLILLITCWEAEADLPWNGYVAGASAALLVFAEICAVLLAIICYRLVGHQAKHSTYKSVPSRRKSSGRDREPLESGFR